MTTKHSPEPWRMATPEEVEALGSDSIFDANGDLCAEGWPGACDPENPRANGDQQEANAQRIVACVNACAGIPTEALEAGLTLDEIASLLRFAYVDEEQPCDGHEDGMETGTCPECRAVRVLKAIGRWP